MLLASLLIFIGLFVFLYVEREPLSVFGIAGIAILNTWIGLPVGFGLWGLYRSIRFAVKG
jgi:hypothetical protein